MRPLPASLVALAWLLAHTAGPVRATQWNMETVDNCDADFCSLAVDQDGQVHMSYVYTGYTDGRRPQLKYAVGNGGSWTIESPGGYGAYSSLALDCGGNHTSATTTATPSVCLTRTKKKVAGCTR